MKTTIAELHVLVVSFSKKFAALSEKEFSGKPLPHKWSKKEVVGHLIDSAQNNLRRFIAGQYEMRPPKITYEQDFWVKANDYQNRNSGEVIMLWKLINEQVCAVLKTMPETNYYKHADTGREHEQLRALQWLAEDYVKHMKHHINQIIPNSFDVSYP